MDFLFTDSNPVAVHLQRQPYCQLACTLGPTTSLEFSKYFTESIKGRYFFPFPCGVIKFVIFNVKCMEKYFSKSFFNIIVGGHDTAHPTAAVPDHIC